MSDTDVPEPDESAADIELAELRELVREFFEAEDRVSLEWGYENYQRARKKLREFMVFGGGE